MGCLLQWGSCNGSSGPVLNGIWKKLPHTELSFAASPRSSRPVHAAAWTPLPTLAPQLLKPTAASSLLQLTIDPLRFRPYAGSRSNEPNRTSATLLLPVFLLRTDIQDSR